MRIDEYITNLRIKNNIILTFSDDQLKIKASQNDLTDIIVEEIKEKKDEILAFFNATGKIKDRIVPVAKQEYYPLSHAQRRLWILDQLVDTAGLYNAPMMSTFESLDLPSFNKAILDLITRHEILRTTIHMIDGEPTQKVHNPQEFDFKICHYKMDQSELNDVIRKESFYPLDLSNSAIRASLVELTDGSFEFILVLHHIVTDGWSMKVLENDFLALYRHHLTGESLDLPELSIQYKDYSHWQHEQLRQGNLDIARNYWLNKLSGEITGLELPLDNKRKELKTYEGAGVAFEINQRFANRLATIGNECGASLFMVLTSLIKILLHRYSGQEDIILGTPITGRDHPDLENQVGFYTNTIVLRTSIKGEDSFIQLLKNVKENTLEAYEHQYYPFDLLVDELNLDRDINRNPLFDVMISYDDSLDASLEHNEALVLEASEDDIISIDGGVNKFDITFTFTRSNNGSIHVNINYNTYLFKKEKMMRMAHHLQNLTAAVLENAQVKISEIEYLSKEETHQVLNVFNETDKYYNLNTSIKELIEAQAKKSPNEISLISHEVSMTFEEMNSKANQFAHYLSDNHNIKKGDYVGVALHGTIDRMITLLGIIKLGATYVPFDAEYPLQRMLYIIEDTKLKVLITDHFSDKNLKKISDKCTLIYAEEALAKSISCPSDNPDIKVDADDVFAILYTSGSTGNPKGVLLINKGIVNRIKWYWSRCKFIKSDVVYQKTNLVFDVSMAELFMSLCFGAKILIADGDSSQEVVENIIKYNVTHIGFSPTILNRLLEQSGDEINKISSLKYVFSGGEELLKETVNRYYSKFNVPLINQYGPTEASIDVTAYEVDPKDQLISLGKPITNVKIYILDDYLRLLPIGVPGEIVIGGVALAKGYLNQNEMTLEKFVPDPYSNEINSRIYKTGDVGRWNDSGEIEFLGRKDNQIRIWGSRIEPGEIESMIVEHPNVKEAAVVVSKDNFGNSHLMAYYVKKDVQSTNPVSISNLVEVCTKENDIYKEVRHVTKDYNMKFCIHELFEKVVEKKPESIALVFEDIEFTYKSINRSANHLASIMKSEHNIGRGYLVGIAMERSEKMIVSILAVLKTGAAYVPIDPDYPDERIKYILNDSSINHVVLNKKSAQSDIFDSIKTIIYEDGEQKLNGHSVLQITSEGSMDDLCYVSYTSGSTGEPKGVMIEHHSVVDYILTFTEYFKLKEDDAVIQQSSISFDTSVEEIFPILCTGGKLIVLPKGGRDIEAIINTLNENSSTILSTTPLVINELNSRHNELNRKPRILISGGDELRPSHIDKLVSETELYNTYGPTETTVCASFALIDNSTKTNIIGESIANHKIYLLNDELEKVPLGEVGELFIAGSGLARGYINRKQETDKYFVSNPFDGGLFYKTGDMGRYSKEGLIEFCGRKDDQVKIRGYRVEPAEVDQVLKQHEKINSCFTTSKTDAIDQKHLIAYYISSDKPEIAELRLFLHERLPHYMVPSYFMEIEEFPQTVNGKINSEKLPVPEEIIVDREFNLELRDFLKDKLPIYIIPTLFRNLDKLPLTATGKIDRKTLGSRSLSILDKQTLITPKNNIEKVILEIWKRCLTRSEISTDDNFFEIGGNSLNATQIVAGIYRELNCNITLKDLFNNQTIRELSQVAGNNTSDKSLVIRLNKVEVNLPNVFFIPPIIGSSTIFRELANKLNSSFNVYGLQYRGFDYDDSFDNSISQMALSFISEIEEIQNDGVVLILGYSMGVPIAFEMAKILEAKGKNVKLILVDRGTGGDIDNESTSIDKEHLDEILESELKYWLDEIKDNDAERIKKLVYNNITLLDNYKVEGEIGSEIAVIEAKYNANKTLMENWKDHTLGNFEHHYIEADHYGILDIDNTSLLSDIISNHFN